MEQTNGVTHGEIKMCYTCDAIEHSGVKSGSSSYQIFYPTGRLDECAQQNEDISIYSNYDRHRRDHNRI